MEDESRASSYDYQRDLWEVEARLDKARRMQQIFQTYVVFGLLISILSLTFFFVRRLEITLSTSDQFILLVAGSGLALSAMSGLWLFLRQQQFSAQIERSRQRREAGDFLLDWARFEALARQRLEAMGRDFNRTSIRKITEALVEAEIISGTELLMIEEILKFRNYLVHSGVRPPQDALANMTSALRSILAKLEA